MILIYTFHTDDTELSSGLESNVQNQRVKNITDKVANVLIDVVLGLHEPRMALISDDANGKYGTVYCSNKHLVSLNGLVR